MKIAVCISGQPRTWKAAKENLINYFDIDAYVDYFIHTWDVNTYSLRSIDISNKPYYSKVENEELLEINNFFKPKKFSFDVYDEKIYSSNYNYLFYSFMKSVWLKKKYELENDFKYDIVIKIRFDINFFQKEFGQKNYSINKFHIHEIKPMVAYSLSNLLSRSPSEFNSTNFDEAVHYADSQTMDLISNVYKWNKKIVDRANTKISFGEFVKDTEYYLGPGTLLYKYMINWGIHPTCEFNVPYYIVRKSALDKKLHSLYDWETIYEISKDYYKNNKDLYNVSKKLL